MPRSKNGTSRRDRRHKIMKSAKGYWGGRSRLFKTAKEAVMKAMASSYRDRRRKKGEFRRLWIARISAAVRPEGITYSQFIHGLSWRREINRKALSNMAIEDPVAFKAIVGWREGFPGIGCGGKMISLEQIRLLESKITRAIELIHVLKDENSTLRRGLESAQKRMKELESLVDGFKTDQGEIETVIVRALHTLDELEEGHRPRNMKQGATGVATGEQQGSNRVAPVTPGQRLALANTPLAAAPAARARRRRGAKPGSRRRARDGPR